MTGTEERNLRKQRRVTNKREPKYIGQRSEEKREPKYIGQRGKKNKNAKERFNYRNALGGHRQQDKNLK